MTRPALERRLRDDAARLRRAPTPDLHRRILEGLEERDPTPLVGPAAGIRRSRRPLGLSAPLLACAAALLFSASIWVVLMRSPGPAGPEPSTLSAGSGDVVALSRDLLRAPLLASVGQVEDPLLAEARNLWADTSRAADSVARGLRTPWRLRTDGE